ncbi:hypothetical protein BC940DRAFT_312357 [Gongronella butleri]|nr:hypothetical protein BC940DRAFT_312357 [Gongronella butleri]
MGGERLIILIVFDPRAPKANRKLHQKKSLPQTTLRARPVVLRHSLQLHGRRQNTGSCWTLTAVGLLYAAVTRSAPNSPSSGLRQATTVTHPLSSKKKSRKIRRTLARTTEEKATRMKPAHSITYIICIIRTSFLRNENNWKKTDYCTVTYQKKCPLVNFSALPPCEKLSL